MAKFTLRSAKQEDAVSIRNLIHLVGINPMGLDWKRFIVAVDAEGRLIGCGQLKPHGADVVELASLAVVPEYQGESIGRAIIECLLADGPRPLYLMCRSRLGPLYEKFGFRSLAPDEMPLYFQRIAKLAGLASALSRLGEGLLVMKLQ